MTSKRAWPHHAGDSRVRLCRGEAWIVGGIEIPATTSISRDTASTLARFSKKAGFLTTSRKRGMTLRVDYKDDLKKLIRLARIHKEAALHPVSGKRGMART